MKKIKMGKKNLLGYQDALSVIERLFEVAEKKNEPVVMVGGTALAAHDIREFSHDVDLYAFDFSDDVVHEVELELKNEYGDNFKIDVTSVENIWGSIMLRDIGNSEPDTRLNIEKRTMTIRKLSTEDLFLLKMDTERKKDRQDLAALYENTDLNMLTTRFNTIWKWHSDRDAVLGYADRFVSIMSKLGGHDPITVIEGLNLPAFMRQALLESWNF